MVRHLKPSFMKSRLKKSSEVAGKNFMSFICCNYWLVKTFAEPFLNASHTVQTLVYSSSECIKKSRMACTDIKGEKREDGNGDIENSSKYEDERKGRSTAFYHASTTPIAKLLYYVAIFLAYSIIIFFIYASFTI